MTRAPGRPILAALLLLLAGAAPLVPPLRLYEARTLVTGTDLRDRPAGLARCLRDVLVQVSGDPSLAGDARVAEAAAHAGDYLRGLDYVDRMSGIAHHDEQGSSDRPYFLTAHFDPAGIDALLASLGEQPWPAPRPTLVPLVSVVKAGRLTTLTSDAPGADDQRAALADAANRYGVPLALPSTDEFTTAARAAADREVIVGALAWSDSDHGWVGTFMRTPSRTEMSATEMWTVRGVSYDEAFRTLVRGAAALASGHADRLADASPP